VKFSQNAMVNVYTLALSEADNPDGYWTICILSKNFMITP